jgi:hypothetical protein
LLCTAPPSCPYDVSPADGRAVAARSRRRRPLRRQFGPRRLRPLRPTSRTSARPSPRFPTTSIRPFATMSIRPLTCPPVADHISMAEIGLLNPRETDGLLGPIAVLPGSSASESRGASPPPDHFSSPSQITSGTAPVRASSSTSTSVRPYGPSTYGEAHRDDFLHDAQAGLGSPVHLTTTPANSSANRYSA